MSYSVSHRNHPMSRTGPPSTIPPFCIPASWPRTRRRNLIKLKTFGATIAAPLNILFRWNNTTAVMNLTQCGAALGVLIGSSLDGWTLFAPPTLHYTCPERPFVRKSTGLRCVRDRGVCVEIAKLVFYYLIKIREATPTWSLLFTCHISCRVHLQPVIYYRGGNFAMKTRCGICEGGYQTNLLNNSRFSHQHHNKAY